MAIFTAFDASSEKGAFMDAINKFKAHYGYDFDGICVVGFKDFYEVAAMDLAMAADASFLASWDCWLFVADVCTYEEYVKACADGTVSKFYEAEA